ncbi:dbr [Drosophila busckii]|uniref:Dbr n=1 Tax=Drosophila busckii TaxID=30019 RepID=A0A0M5J8J6_DROBS|nr:dbr [Drosophila busckii]
MDAQFEHLCRICAANTKNKNTSVAESVFILKTAGLRDKIAKHLFLTVAEDDPLPKVLCKSCYRQVEATASLSNIAKHTQRVFRDFLLSTMPKLGPVPQVPSTQNQDTSASASVSISSKHTNSNNSNSNSNNNRSDHRRENPRIDTFQPIMLTRPPETTIIPLPPRNVNVSEKKKEEIVITLANKDNAMQQKKQRTVNFDMPLPGAHQFNKNNTGGIKMKNAMLPARRNSVFVDSRYNSAPMSIAQRSMQLPPSLAPLHTEISLSESTKSSPEKKPSPAGVINFIQTHGRITGKAPTIITSGIGNSYMPIRPAAASTSSISTAGVPQLPSNVLQQKRRNLKNALSNISALRDGQVSLLKSSHPRQTTDDIDIRPLVTTTVVPHQAIYGEEQSVEEALPEHIIIAAPKKKREEPPALAPATNAQKNGPTAAKTTKPAAEAPPVAAKSKLLPSMGSLPDVMSLGNVIRDPDLLRLILKALKWPVTSINSEEQMSRLKNSKFSVIMSDSNLLQDNDLTQILGPYLTPIMAAVQQQQQNQSTPNAAKETSPAKSPAHEATELRLMGTDVNPCTMPYKLPPETSVQLVPSSPTEQTPQLPVSPSKSESRSSNAKRSQRKMRARGDADTSAAANTSSAARVANELLNINTTLVSQFGSNPADAINEALISILKQREKLHSQPTRRRRSSTPADTNSELNLEDIVLVETPASLETEADGDGNANVVSFKLPAQILPEPTVVTRPIIKRRKTNAQTSNQQQKDATAKTHIETTNTTTTTPTAKTEPARASTAPVERSLSMETSVNESAVEIEPQAPTSTMPESTTLKSAEQQLEDEDEATEEVAANNGEDNSLNKPAADSNRKEDVKAVLGKKLLEAIGLPQLAKNVPVETSRDTLRSALKRSLKQAQEQQQHLKRLKQEEPVKQMADSTTKPVAGESAEEHKKAIAERELELLKRKSKSMELNKTLKDDKLERTNDISSSSRNRRSRYKSKTDINDDSGAEDGRKERWDEDDDLPLRAESRLSDPGTSSNRPTRTSKTMSKYYKSPGNEKGLLSQKSQHAMGTRSTRQR